MEQKKGMDGTSDRNRRARRLQEDAARRRDLGLASEDGEQESEGEAGV